MIKRPVQSALSPAHLTVGVIATNPMYCRKTTGCHSLESARVSGWAIERCDTPTTSRQPMVCTPLIPDALDTIMFTMIITTKQKVRFVNYLCQKCFTVVVEFIYKCIVISFRSLQSLTNELDGIAICTRLVNGLIDLLLVILQIVWGVVIFHVHGINMDLV